MSKKKKRVLVITIVIVAVLLVQMVVAGWLGGLGPLAFLRNVRMHRSVSSESALGPSI